MANLKLAIDFVLRQEDSEMTGAVTIIPGDQGGPTRFGIASTFHPDLVKIGYFDPTRVPYAEALALAEQTYKVQYADPMWVEKIDDQALATAVLSFGIDTGVVRPVRFLQQTVSQLGHSIVVDGKMGDITLGYCNTVGRDVMLNGFAQLSSRYYQGLADQNPVDQVVIHGWLNRVAAWLKNAADLRTAAGQASGLPVNG